jgi:hypothetical protein
VYVVVEWWICSFSYRISEEVENKNEMSEEGCGIELGRGILIATGICEMWKSWIVALIVLYVLLRVLISLEYWEVLFKSFPLV